MIVRGTTPYHSFILPLEPAQIQVLYITYLQNNVVILDKEYTSESEEITIEPYNDELENASMNEQQSEDDICVCTIKKVADASYSRVLSGREVYENRESLGFEVRL